MKPEIQDIVFDRLESASVLPGGFDKAHNNPYNLAPFNSSDLRCDLRTAV